MSDIRRVATEIVSGRDTPLYYRSYVRRKVNIRWLFGGSIWINMKI
jgi:hypothetical protein